MNPKTTPPAPPEARAVPETDRRGWALVVDLEAKLTEPQRQALHQPADRGRLAQLATELGRLAGGGWTSEELLAHVGAELPGSWRSPARLLWARAQALPTAPPSPEDLRAAADAARAASQIQAAQAYAANQAAVDFLEPAEIVARLAECYSGEALEAAVATLAQCRPGDDVAGAVRDLAQSPAGRVGPELEDEMIALDVGDMVEADLERRHEAMFPWPPDDDPEADSAPVDEGRTRRRSTGSPGPVAVGGLLGGFGEEGP